MFRNILIALYRCTKHFSCANKCLQKDSDEGPHWRRVVTGLFIERVLCDLATTLPLCKQSAREARYSYEHTRKNESCRRSPTT